MVNSFLFLKNSVTTVSVRNVCIYVVYPNFRPWKVMEEDRKTFSYPYLTQKLLL